jgi:tetratricopeptide (TPR) repeat protein
MNSRRLPLALAIWLALAAATWAFDQVKTTGGSTITGRVLQMSALEVTAEQGSISKTVPVNEIESISYDNEPAVLKSARLAVAAGNYEEAVASLEKIETATADRPEIAQDVEFYKALAAARIALAGGGDVEEARKLMGAFATKSTGNYHYLEACEIVGDLLVANANYAPAEVAYGYLAKAPWPDYRMRAAVAVGHAQLAGGKPAEALQSFESALAIQAPSAAGEGYRQAATLGKARCLAEADKSDEAIKLVEKVLAQADPENSDLQADAYNALGIACRKAGRPKDALLAFLHVDVLYFSSPRRHIEALTNLNELWMEVQKPERAADVARTLRDRYKVSPEN